MSVSAAVSSLPSLPAGDNNIGNVDVVSLPALPAGDNNIGNVDVVTLPALVEGLAVIGKTWALNYGYVAGSAQKDPIRFGYSGVVNEVKSNLTLPAATTNLDTTAVPPGEIHVLTQIGWYYAGTVPTAVWIELRDGSNDYHLFHSETLVSGEFYDHQGYWVLSQGYFIRATVYGPTLNDDFYLSVTGFRVDIDQ